MPVRATYAVAALIRASCRRPSQRRASKSAAKRRFYLMPGWPEKRVHIGSYAKRIDAPAKVTGAAKYASDVQPEGWLYGMILRSKWPKAKILKIDLEKAKAVPGIKAAILAPRFEKPDQTSRYYGEELAAVAGTTKQACLDALRVIEVEVKEMPFVVREEDAKDD